MSDRQKLVDHVKGYIYSHPDMNMNLAREMAKFVQNLYDMQIEQGKMIEKQKATIAVLKQDQIIRSII
jgi:hypothetical protein